MRLDAGFGGEHNKKLIARDPLLDLMAFYAPRGIAPACVFAMGNTERAVLRAARARYYEEQVALIRAGIVLALAPPEERGEQDGGS